MIELFRMWRYTKMVVLTAFSAALYAAILIPFKVVIPLIPGFTEFRPANAIPIITSIFFGPAGTWGSAIGNFIGDALGGTLGLGSIFGFFGNFLYGLIPYKILYPETLKSKNLPLLVFIILNASLVCAVVIGWGVDLLGLVPFAALGSIIFLNNFIVAVILAPVLVNIFHKRLVAWGLLYTEIMDKADLPTVKSPLVKKLGIGLLLIGGASGIIIGNLISIGIYKSSLLA
ncbi:MAG: QueT transporter family protein, partial [candidate division WOR-3 bacterium]